MAQTLLINQKYLTDKSVINDNTDYNLLVPVIVVAQDLDIMPLLGSDLYKVIIDAVAAGTIAGDNKTLLDTYVQPCLLYFVMAKSPIILRFRYKNRYRDWETDRKSTRLNSSHSGESRMPSSA